MMHADFVVMERLHPAWPSAYSGLATMATCARCGELIAWLDHGWKHVERVGEPQRCLHGRTAYERCVNCEDDETTDLFPTKFDRSQSELDAGR